MPKIESNHPNLLSKQEKKVLQQLFKDYTTLSVRKEFNSGFSTSRVLLVQPIKGDDFELPAIVKIDHGGAVAAEVLAYHTHIARKLQNAIKIVGEPANIMGSEWGGARYEFAGGDLFKTVSLQEYVETRSPKEIEEVFGRIQTAFHMLYDRRRKSPAFRFGRYYDRILPINFRAEFMPHPTGPVSWRTPDQTPFPVKVGEQLQLHGFVILKQIRDKNTLMCSTPQPDGDFHFFIEKLPSDIDWDDYPVGESISQPICGRVTQTRPQFLQEKISAVFGTTRPELLSDSHLFPDPLAALSEQLNKISAVDIAPIHGDLNLQNVLVEENGTVHFIDFAQTREDHLLRDAIHMEMVLVTALLAPLFSKGGRPAVAIAEFYRYLHCAVTDEAYATLPERWAGEEWARLFAAILAVRRMARPCLNRQDQWEEYYQGLYFYMLGSLKFGSLYGSTAGHYPAQLAYWVAAITLEFMERPPNAEDMTPPRQQGPHATPDAGTKQQVQHVTGQAGGNQPIVIHQKTINTGGGTYVEGGVNTGGGAFVGRDQTVHHGSPHTSSRSPSPSGNRVVHAPTMRKILASRYTLTELKILCEDLEIDYNDFPHATRQELALELVGYCRRHNELERLSQAIPDKFW